MAVIRPERIRQLSDNPGGAGPVIWWLQRDQRLRDNWAALYAYGEAKRRDVPLVAAFALSPGFLGATMRQYDFMLAGLQELEADLAERQIPFRLLFGDAGEELPRLAKELEASLIVTDFNPLRLPRAWREEVAKKAPCPVREVDAHNVVPAWHASDKREVGARTLRPKLNRLLPDFLEPFPRVIPRNDEAQDMAPTDWDAVRASLKVDRGVPPVTWIKPGERAAHAGMKRFLESRLNGYDEGRNDPTERHQSDLSPYLHFGQLSAQRVALAARETKVSADDRAAFAEELIVRRELSDNFCLHESAYDMPECFPKWARASLDLHAKDKREFVYTRDELEAAATHDDLWNAAQIEMVRRGKMHGYLRMYWAKKILEWSATYQEAQENCIYLNDRYFLDGRDPNGYAGVAWSVGGLHDRPWFDRPVYGVVRYMNRNGAERKFDVKKYVAWANALDEGGREA